MPQKIKPDPYKTCRNCNSVMSRKRHQGALESTQTFKRRVFCNRTCMAEWMEGRTTVPGDQNGRRQAAKTTKPACEICGRNSTRLCVHHKDENPRNNEKSNLITLCGSCHGRCHSPNYTKMGRLREPCKYCTKPSARQGLCNTHLSRLKRYGDALAKKIKRGSEWVLTHVGG